MSLFGGFKKESNSEPQEEGFYFASKYELAVYGKLYGKDKKVYWLHGDRYADALNKAGQLFDQGEYRKAIQAYQESLTINPIGVAARFEIAEAYICLKEYDKAKRTLLAMRDYLVQKEAIAKFYRRYGFAEIELCNYSTASACMLYSLNFEKNARVTEELAYIKSKSPNVLFPQKPDEELRKAGIPLLAPEEFEFKDMDAPKSITVTCPKCGRTIKAQQKQRFIVSKDNDADKKKFVEEQTSFFDVHCPKCGSTIKLEYPLQYIDYDKRINIYLMPNGHPDEQKFFDTLDQFNTERGFLTRLVDSVDTLADKIRIADAGLDDRVVEICKLLLWGDLCEERSDFNDVEFTDSWFIPVNSKDYENAIMYAYKKNGKPDTITLEVRNDYYNSIKEAFEPFFPYIKTGLFDEINRKWAYNAFDVRNKKLAENN